MATTVKYQSRVRERVSQGQSDTVVYQGDKESVEAFAAEHYINDAGERGYLKSIRTYQDQGDIWCCELRYESDLNGGYVEPPATAYGKTSATLRGSMLSLPLEEASGYRARWNNFLQAKGTTAVPSWWETATSVDTIPAADREKYKWSSTVDTPSGWGILKKPTKPGVNSIDVATYSITESARFSSASAAGQYVQNRLNRIGTPSSTFGITGGNWKCDDATISYAGKYWIGTLTWTRSGDNKGWDTDLYGNS